MWDSLVDSASFASMRANADNIAPDTNHNAWKDNQGFFNKGENAQWRNLLSAEMLALYEQVRDQRAPGDFGQWLESGYLSANIDYH